MITARDIVKRYDRLTVLDHVSIDIGEREILAITGPSGAGKTTLLQIIGSLDRPDAGSVEFDGVSLSAMNERRLSQFRNANIGFVFQFHQLLPEFTMVENVALPAMIGGMSKSKATERAMALIDYMGLSARAHHKPSQLSGGERQRAAVARALVNEPRVVLADEPSGSLDTHNRQELHNLFFNLRRDMGHTFVIVTHDESLATTADRTVRLRDGRVDEIIVNPDPRL